MSTRWKPDTCGCIVVYDNEQRGEEVEIINIRFEQSCAQHEGVKRWDDRFKAVLATNKRGR